MHLPLMAELKRRRVFRALVGYGIAAAAVLQITEPILHGLHWPDAVLSYVVLALALGFPIVVCLAWIFDVTEQGVVRSPPHSLRRGPLALVLIGIGVLAAAPGSLWYFVVRRAPAEVSPAGEALASIAVLPFTDMSPGKDQEYFSDGISEEILNALAQVEGLHVAGRTSAFSFKGKNEDLRTVGQSLGVAAVLEGSVRKAGNRVRVTAQLVKVADGFHLWSQTFDRDLGDVFALQDEIARSVVAATTPKLLPVRVPEGRRTTNSEAYGQFLLGRKLSSSGVAADYRRAVEAYERAITLDPSYAPAHAGLSESQMLLVNADLTTLEARLAGQQRAIDEAELAVKLAPDLAEAYRARSSNRMTVIWDWEGAEQDIRRALALAPGDARVLLWKGHLDAVLGRLPDALAETRRALELDPLFVQGWDFLGRYLAASGQLEEARQAFERALRIAPGSIWVRRELAYTWLLGGEPDRARVAFEQQEGWIRVMGLALAQHDLGRRDVAEKWLRTLTESPDPPAYQVAQVYAWWGDRDRALQWLSRCRSTGDAGLRYIGYDPLLRKIRSDPQFAAFLRSLGLRPG